MLLRTRRQTSKLIFFNNISFKSFFLCFPSAFHGDFFYVSLCRVILTKQILFSGSRRAVASGGGHLQHRGQETRPRCLLRAFKSLEKPNWLETCSFGYLIPSFKRRRISSLRDATWKFTEVPRQKTLSVALWLGKRFCSYGARNTLSTRSELVTAIKAKALLN